MRIKSLVVLSLVCSLSQAADTVAFLGDSIKATQFVTEVDHTKLINGTTEVTANADGTASISVSSSIQKENCLRVTRTDGSTGKTIVISFQNTSDELSEWYSTWPSQLSFTVEYDGVTYDAVTVGESDSEDCREISSSLSWLNGSSIWPNGSTSPSYWDGAILGVSTPGGLDIIGDGNGESCSTYTYTSSIGTSALIATVDQISEFVDKSVTNGLASTSFVNNALSGKMNTVACIAEGDVAVIMPDGNAHDSGSHINSFSQTNHVHYSITTDEPGLIGGDGATLEIHNNGTATVTWHPGSAPPTPGEPAPKSWTKVLAFTNDIQAVPSNVSAFNNDAGYVTANHTHSNLVNGTTEVVANNDGTASIVNTIEVYGFKVSAHTRDQSRNEGSQPILIEMEIPVPLTIFDDAMFRTVQSIRLRICEPLTGGSPREIVPWQTVALDHTKFGGPESQYFGIADNAITQVNSEWFTSINPGYNWINDIYNAPFRINYANATVSSLYTAWGPLGSTTEDILTADLVGKKRQIVTIDQIQPIATTIARQIIRDAVSNVSTNIQSAEDARVSLTNLIAILKNL